MLEASPQWFIKYFLVWQLRFNFPGKTWRGPHTPNCLFCLWRINWHGFDKFGGWDTLGVWVCGWDSRGIEIPEHEENLSVPKTLPLWKHGNAAIIPRPKNVLRYFCDFLAIFCYFCNNQKNPRVRKILVRNSGAGNGCANFMDTWKMRSFCRKTHVHKFLLLGGGDFGFFWGGECRFYF